MIRLILVCALAMPGPCWARSRLAPFASVRVHARTRLVDTDNVRTRPFPPIARSVGLSRSIYDRPLQPVMTEAEALTLQWYASQAATYVEYGSGASTVLAAPLAGRALSIDNSVPWCKEMKARMDVAFWVAQGKLQYVCVDVGQTGKEKRALVRVGAGESRTGEWWSASTSPCTMPSAWCWNSGLARMHTHARHPLFLLSQATGATPPTTPTAGASPITSTL